MNDGEKPDLSYALDRVKRLLRPPVSISAPPEGIRFERDVEVRVRDGTVLRVNVFRPQVEGRYPVIMCAHPYGKDNLPRRTPLGYVPTFTYRVMRQSAPFSISAWTSWEGPDPAWWVPQGYVLVNADLRGFFRSEGTGELFSDQEAEDYYDLIEWAGVQPWSSGRVGTNGVSYLALSQWKVAALRPPHLAAICPWEGFSDLYRDLARPGGIREDGFVRVWSKGVSTQKRCRTDLRAEQLRRPLFDEWWAATVPELAKITVPALICASFSDHNLHSRGSFRAFGAISSEQRWLYTHRGGKWATYYSAEALDWQRRFFGHFLKDEEPGWAEVPRVRLEVRDTGEGPYQVRAESAWPPPGIEPVNLYLHPDGRLREEASASGEVSFDSGRGRASFSWRVPHDLELTGPMRLSLELSVEGADDVHVFAGLRKIRAGRHVVFEGSYGFGFDMVSHGWLKASQRRLDGERSSEWLPEHALDVREPLTEGQPVKLEIALLPSSTFFREGDELRLDLQGHWFFAFNPLLGHFPANYEVSPAGTTRLRCGQAHLLLPILRAPGRPA